VAVRHATVDFGGAGRPAGSLFPHYASEKSDNRHSHFSCKKTSRNNFPPGARGKLFLCALIREEFLFLVLSTHLPDFVMTISVP